MEDAPGLKHDDKKDVAWDAAAGKQPLENQRNSSRLGSSPLRSVAVSLCQAKKLTCKDFTAD